MKNILSNNYKQKNNIDFYKNNKNAMKEIKKIDKI